MLGTLYSPLRYAWRMLTCYDPVLARRAILSLLNKLKR
jgi:hypothetical protein